MQAANAKLEWEIQCEKASTQLSPREKMVAAKVYTNRPRSPATAGSGQPPVKIGDGKYFD